MAIREIEFRGKRIDNGEWVYGLFARCKVGNLILPCIQRERENDSGDYIEAIIVNGNTLGQYTGIKDKNGNKIFEGDIIELSYEKEQKKHIRTVMFAEEMFILAFKNGSGASLGSYDTQVNRPFMEIIGNIHDKEEDENESK